MVVDKPSRGLKYLNNVNTHTIAVKMKTLSLKIKFVYHFIYFNVIAFLSKKHKHIHFK